MKEIDEAELDRRIAELEQTLPVHLKYCNIDATARMQAAIDGGALKALRNVKSCLVEKEASR